MDEDLLKLPTTLLRYLLFTLISAASRDSSVHSIELEGNFPRSNGCFSGDTTLHLRYVSGASSNIQGIRYASIDCLDSGAFCQSSPANATRSPPQRDNSSFRPDHLPPWPKLRLSRTAGRAKGGVGHIRLFLPRSKEEDCHFFQVANILDYIGLFPYLTKVWASITP